MRVRVNSEDRNLEEGMTVSGLKELLGVNGAMSAVAVNGVIVKGDLHSSYALKDGDEVVVIGAAYGG